MNEATQFFFDNAGLCYHPDRESQFVGLFLSAAKLARAEAWAHSVGALFEWDVDHDIDSSEWSDEQPPYEQYECVMYTRCADCDTDTDLTADKAISECTRKLSYHVRQSLGGIDFGRGGFDARNSYVRVVQAELALEAMHTGALS